MEFLVLFGFVVVGVMLFLLVDFGSDEEEIM